MYNDFDANGTWNNPDRQIDHYANGEWFERGERVIAQMPYGDVECTYMYPSLGVSSLTNATVSTFRGAMQIPASLLTRKV